MRPTDINFVFEIDRRYINVVQRLTERQTQIAYDGKIRCSIYITITNLTKTILRALGLKFFSPCLICKNGSEANTFITENGNWNQKKLICNKKEKLLQKAACETCWCTDLEQNACVATSLHSNKEKKPFKPSAFQFLKFGKYIMCLL